MAESDEALLREAEAHAATVHPDAGFTAEDLRGLLRERAYTNGSSTDSQAVTVVRRVFRDVWEKQDRAAAEECFSADYTNHDSTAPELPPGPQGVMETVRVYSAAFPDHRFTLEETLVAGDKVVVRWTVTGRHTGPLGGFPPSHRAVTITGLSVFRVANGKIVESWANWDQAGLLQQIGALANPANAAM
jgi:steroid delta-isomerase-like uncharacterized protein